MKDDWLELASLLQLNLDRLLARWRELLRQLPHARKLDTPTLDDHIPEFLEAMVAALQSGAEESVSGEPSKDPPVHGLHRLANGFDIVEVVAEYNLLRRCIFELADQNKLNLGFRTLNIVNGALDQAIGLAVGTFAKQRELEVQHRREEYLSFVAHDLRTPLNVVAMATTVLETRLLESQSSPEMPQLLKALRRSVNHLDSLVSRVLDENRHLEADSGLKVELRTLDLWPLVEGLNRDLQPIANSGNTQLLNEVPDELMVLADANLLRRILQNLMANAIRHTPNGKVRIGARHLREEALVECWISDNGTGIPKDFVGKVFEKGKTERAAVGGTGHGLGLAIVKTFVEAHGGTVSVESTEGMGATFTFTLPASRS